MHVVQKHGINWGEFLLSEPNMRERKKEATKVLIMDVTVKLINERGFANTTMQLIAQKADVALRTLYNYFASKETIVATYVQMAVKREQEKNWTQLMAFDTTTERLEFLCLKSAEWMKKNVVLAEVYTLEIDPRSYICGPFNTNFPRSGLEDVVAEIIEKGRDMGDVTKEVPIRVLTRHFLGFYHFSILNWLCDTSQELELVFKQGLGLVFSGIETKDVCPGTVLQGMFY